MFLNYMDAHEPYEPPEEFLSKFRNDNCSVDISWHLRSLNEQYSESEKKCISDRYDASLRHLDDHLGRLFNILEERNLADDTLIVLTSDHGKCLGEHNYMGVGTFLYNELIRIPLVVSPPSRETWANASDLISQIDIHQHILEAAGVDTPKRGYDGVYSETIGPHQDVTVRSRSLPEEGLRRIEIDGTSLIRDINTNEASFEGSPISDQRVKLERLESEYVNGMVEFRKQRVDEDMDEATRDHLEELGYL
jgi:arylsulfatase A-like enzyme